MNAFNGIDPRLVDYVLPVDQQGYPEHEMLADRESGVLSACCGSASRRMPDSLRVEPKEWAARARENDRNGTWAMNYRDRYTNQEPTHECTCHSFDANYAVARNRSRAVRYPEGPKKNYRYDLSGQRGSVFGSPLSLYVHVRPKTARNPYQRGGAGVRQVLEVACKYGYLPDRIQPHDYKFKHTLHGTAGRGNINQSSGPYISLDDLPEGWEETGKLLMPLEVVFPESFEDAVSLIINGYAVSVGRNGHAVPWCKLMFSGDRLDGAAYPDSYDITRYDSLRTMKYAWQGSFCIINTVTPDDWMNPAA